jgi:hypothetical protein
MLVRKSGAENPFLHDFLCHCLALCLTGLNLVWVMLLMNLQDNHVHSVINRICSITSLPIINIGWLVTPIPFTVNYWKLAAYTVWDGLPHLIELWKQYVSLYITLWGHFCKARAGVLRSSAQTAKHEGLKKTLKYSTSTKNSSLLLNSLLQSWDVLPELHNTKCVPHNALTVTFQNYSNYHTEWPGNFFYIFIRQVPRRQFLW